MAEPRPGARPITQTETGYHGEGPLDDWTWVGGEIVATKDYDFAEAELAEHTTLVLRHTPVP